jgi:hypothetical protein
VTLPETVWELHTRYFLYAKESGNLHITTGEDIFVNSLVRTAFAITGQANVLTLSLVNSSLGNPIISGTVNFYLYDKEGENAGKWYRGSDGTWQSSESIAGQATHRADGHWYMSFPSEVWERRIRYRFYAKESGDLHVPTGLDVLAGDLTGLSIGTDELEVSPAYILAVYLIDYISKLSWPTSGNDWHLYISMLPDGGTIPVECGVIYDSTPLKQARLMLGPVVQRFGIELRIRGDDYETTKAKIENIASTLDTVWNQTVTIGATNYNIANISRVSMVPLGWEHSLQKRINFTLNLLVGIQIAS